MKTSNNIWPNQKTSNGGWEHAEGMKDRIPNLGPFDTKAGKKGLSKPDPRPLGVWPL